MFLKQFLVFQTYIEWQLLKQEDRSSKSIEAQLERWLIFFNQNDVEFRITIYVMLVSLLLFDYSTFKTYAGAMCYGMMLNNYMVTMNET